jgi:hypothetical protein
MRWRAAAILIAILVAGCAAGGGAQHALSGRAVAARTLHWSAFDHARTPVDLAGTASDGSVVLAGGQRLSVLSPSGRIRPFAPAYHAPGGEPYVALFEPVGRHAACFGPGVVYALALGANRGVVSIRAGGTPRQLVHLSAPGLLDGIAFDRTGGFGYRLLVTAAAKATTTVYAIDCHGHAQTITSHAARVEGGIAVAPHGFGRFGGDLIAPDELSGNIYAITPRGRSVLVARSGLPHGQDIGVESEGFVPSGSHFEMLVSDRLTPGNPHPGDNLILRIRSAALHAAGVHAGDMIVVAEGGGLTDVVHCGAHGCQARAIAQGPAIAHIEGHVVALPG